MQQGGQWQTQNQQVSFQGQAQSTMQQWQTSTQGQQQQFGQQSIDMRQGWQGAQQQMHTQNFLVGFKKSLQNFPIFPLSFWTTRMCLHRVSTFLQVEEFRGCRLLKKDSLC